MKLSTRLTELLDTEHPILLAPMDLVADGRLAMAVSEAGGLGMIGGGYGDAAWLKRELDVAADARVGVGFITWSLAKQPDLLDLALGYGPPAVMLSFGDVTPFAGRINSLNGNDMIGGGNANMPMETITLEITRSRIKNGR